MNVVQQDFEVFPSWLLQCVSMAGCEGGAQPGAGTLFPGLSLGLIFLISLVFLIFLEEEEAISPSGQQVKALCFR